MNLARSSIYIHHHSLHSRPFRLMLHGCWWIWWFHNWRLPSCPIIYCADCYSIDINWLGKPYMQDIRMLLLYALTLVCLNLLALPYITTLCVPIADFGLAAERCKACPAVTVKEVWNGWCGNWFESKKAAGWNYRRSDCQGSGMAVSTRAICTLARGILCG